MQYHYCIMSMPLLRIPYRRGTARHLETFHLERERERSVEPFGAETLRSEVGAVGLVPRCPGAPVDSGVSERRRRGGGDFPGKVCESVSVRGEKVVPIRGVRKVEVQTDDVYVLLFARLLCRLGPLSRAFRYWHHSPVRR